MDKIITTPIDGVLLENLPVISTTGGAVLKMLKADSPLFPPLNGFGELYFSEINPGVIRAWKKHKKQEQRFAVPSGMVKLGFFDARAGSATKGAAFAMLLGRPDAYRLLAIPKGIWYGFEGVSDTPALICNFATLPHDPQEIERAPVAGGEALVDWESLALWTPE